MRFTAVFLPVFAIAMLMICSRVSSAPTDVAPKIVAPAAATATDTPSPHVESTPPPAANETTAFQNGTIAFQRNDFSSARLWFRQTLTQNPAQVAAWYDLGLTEERLGHAGFAMAFWRKALAISPRFSEATYAIETARAKLEHPDIAHDVETWESLRSNVLLFGSTLQFSAAAMVLFFIASWLSLIYFGRRRRARLDEKPRPPFPYGSGFVTLLFAGFLVLAVCKVIDDQDLRATIVVKNIEVKALPDPSSTSLFELYEGLEIILRQSRTDWVQVTYPGGATGWIPRNSVFTMSDRIAP